MSSSNQNNNTAFNAEGVYVEPEAVGMITARYEGLQTSIRTSGRALGFSGNALLAEVVHKWPHMPALLAHERFEKFISFFPSFTTKELLAMLTHILETHCGEYQLIPVIGLDKALNEVVYLHKK